MSTTVTPTESQSSRLGIDPEHAFDDLAFHDPTVCSRCFSLIRRHDTFRPDADGGVSKYAPDERCVRAHDGEKGYRVEDMDEYGVLRVHRPRTFCGECGSQSGRADNITLSRRLALSFADNLVDRLRSAGVAVDTRTLKYAVKKLKNYEQLEAYDTEIFRRSTKIAIKHARY